MEGNNNIQAKQDTGPLLNPLKSGRLVPGAVTGSHPGAEAGGRSSDGTLEDS